MEKNDIDNILTSSNIEKSNNETIFKIKFYTPNSILVDIFKSKKKPVISSNATVTFFDLENHNKETTINGTYVIVKEVL